MLIEDDQMREQINTIMNLGTDAVLYYNLAEFLNILDKEDNKVLIPKIKEALGIVSSLIEMSSEES